MILEAESAYYMAALSKHDLKPSLKIKNFLLGFAGCCFFQKLPPEGRLNHETYVFGYTSDPEDIELEIVYTSDPENVKIEIVYTSDPKNIKIEIVYTSDPDVKIEIVYTSDPENVKIEIVYTSDTEDSKKYWGNNSKFY